MTTITRDQLIALNPCGLDDRLKLFGRRKSMTVKQALAAGASIDGVLWVAGALGLKDECARFAVKCAERVVHLDASGTARPCIASTMAYLADPSAENWKLLAAARDAAGDAAWAAAGAAETEAQKLILMEVFG